MKRKLTVPSSLLSDLHKNTRKVTFLRCQMPTDGNIAPLNIPTAQLKSTGGHRWEMDAATAEM